MKIKKIFFFLIAVQVFFVYSEDLYKVKYNNKYGFINTQKDIVIEPQYDYAENFFSGNAIVVTEKSNQKFYNIINVNNKIVDENLKDCSRLCRALGNIFYNSFEGYFYDIDKRKRIELDKYAVPFFYNNNQKYYSPCINYDLNRIEYVDGNFKTIFSCYNVLKAFAMTDNMAFVIKKDWSQAIINNKGEEIIADVFDSGMNSSEGLLAVETDKESGYINNKGKFVFHCCFEPNNHDFSPPGLNYPFSEGVAAVQVRRGIFRIYDKKGNIILNEKAVLDMKPCSDGFILYQTFDNKYGFLKKDGRNAFYTEFDYAEPFYNGFTIIGYEGNDAILDKLGNIFLSKDLIEEKKKVFINVSNK